ncbi:MAG: helix-turn-helix domain-containing protein [Bacilli bacterium]|nr:helix-turn-helix domain-containing protein [Bacilli bacterium]
MKFSEKLIKLRKENKLSQEQLASKLDVSRQSVSKWESGQTYPEMDKLISLCKIFKCSLDDLTNDEIQELNISQNKKNGFITFIYEMLEFINKSISMLKAMTFKGIIKMLLEFIVLGFFLLLFRFPFALMIDFGYKVFNSLDMSHDFITILFHGWELLVNIIYFILFIIIFIYIYKVRYLDKFQESEEIIIKYINEKKDNTKNTKEDIKVEERIVIKKERTFALFNILGTIIKYIIKFIIVCIFLPFVFTLAVLAFLLIIDIIFLFKGIVFIGILLGIIFALLFNYMLIEMMFKFIFNISINFKKIFIMFIVGVFGIGISVGIFALEATSLKVYDELPKEIEIETTIKEFNINEDSYIIFDEFIADCDNENNCRFLYTDGYNIIKKYDENMKDKIKIEVTNNKDFTSIEINENNGKVEINKNYISDYNTIIRMLDVVINNLKNKELYTMDSYKLNMVTVIITTSEENYEILNRNESKKVSEIYEENIQNINNQYEQEINDLELEIERLNDRILELEIEKDEEISNLKEQLEEKEYELQEYKDKIANLLDE